MQSSRIVLFLCGLIATSFSNAADITIANPSSSLVDIWIGLSTNGTEWGHHYLDPRENLKKKPIFPKKESFIDVAYIYTQNGAYIINIDQSKEKEKRVKLLKTDFQSGGLFKPLTTLSFNDEESLNIAATVDYKGDVSIKLLNNSENVKA